MKQIVLVNVTNDKAYHPIAGFSFCDRSWYEAKTILAWVLRQTNLETCFRSDQWLIDRMVGADFPAGNGYCNGITCIANSGEHSMERGEFSAYNIEGSTYIYESGPGDFCIAQIPDDGSDIQYYRISVLNY